MTIEKLARMIEQGFRETATLRDLGDFRDAVEKRFDHGDEERRATHEQIRLIWAAVNRIEKEILGDHARRIERIESKLGIG